MEGPGYYDERCGNPFEDTPFPLLSMQNRTDLQRRSATASLASWCKTRISYPFSLPYDLIWGQTIRGIAYLRPHISLGDLRRGRRLKYRTPSW